MLFYLVTSIIFLIYILYPKSKWEAAVFVFVAFIIQGRLLGENDQFIGFIDHRSFATVILIATSFSFKNIAARRIELDKFKKLVISFAIFMIIILMRYIEVKDGILYNTLDLNLTIKRIARDSLFIYAIYLIAQRMYNFNTLRGLENGMIFGIIIAIFSMLFYSQLVEMGFALHHGIGEQNLRLTGFLGMDSNEAAGLFNIVYGYILARQENKRKFSYKYILIISLLVLGLMILASKTGFLIFVTLTLIFIYRNTTGATKTIKNSLLVIIIAVIFFLLFGDFMAERIKEQISGESDTLKARQTYWAMYLKDISENWNYLIIGNLDKPTYHRSVHNTYIHFLFYTGVIPVFIILTFFWKIYKNRKIYINNYYYYTPIYALLANIIYWITVPTIMNYWFILIIAGSTGISYENFKKYNFSKELRLSL